MNEIHRGLLAGILLLSCIQILRGQDVHEVSAERGEFYTQCTTNRPDTDLDRAHLLQLVAYPAYNGSILSATVANHSLSTVLPSDANGIFWTNLHFAAAAPGGTYVFDVMTASQGSLSLKVPLPGPANGIAPLRVANFPETQAVDSTQDFTLTWDKAPKLNSHDYAFVEIFDTNDVSVFTSQQFDVSQTNALIPAETLQPNTTYNAYLYFRHYFFLQNHHLPVSAARELHATYFRLKTLNPAGVFQFGPNPIVVNELDGAAYMSVERTQGSQGDVTVDYFSSDRTAVAGTNYTAVSGTLDFPDGVTNQNIAVPILNDGVATQPLAFRLTLSNAASGAGLVTRPDAAVTILDSESAPSNTVNGYLLAKVRYYSQSGENLPTQSNLCVAARFYASIHPKFPGLVTNASLQMPKNGSITLTNMHDFVEYDADFPSVAAMNKTFPPGKYKLDFATMTDGSFSPTLVFGAEQQFPVPRVTNPAKFGTIDPSNPFTIEWNSFTGATTNDYVLVAIRDSSLAYVLRTPEEFEPGALPGTTPSFTIPAGTLDYGHKYLVDVIFSKVIELPQVYPGVRNGVASVHATSFYIQTLSDPVPASLKVQTDCPCHSAGFEFAPPAQDFLADPDGPDK